MNSEDSVTQSSSPELDKRMRVRTVLGLSFLLAGAVVGAAVTHKMDGAKRGSSEVMAVVAGTPVTRVQFNHQMEIQHGTDVLKKLIDEETFLRFAEQQNILPTDAAIQERVSSLQANPLTSKRIKERQLADAEVARDVQVQLVREAIFGADAAVTEKDIEDYYRTQLDPRNPSAKFYSPEIARVSIISTVTEEEGRAAEALLKSGKPFAEAARLHSKDRTSANGGDAPPLVRGRSVFFRLDPKFEADVFKLKPGEWTQSRKVGRSKFWIIVKCNSTEPARTIPLEEVREQCRQQAAAIKANMRGPTKLSTEFEAFRRKVPVEIYWEQYFYDITGRKAPGAK